MSLYGNILRAFARDEAGATAVEAALLSGVFVMIIGGGIEMGFAYHQKSAAESAARHGARMAATNASVSSWLSSYSGLGSGVAAGDPMPDYTVTCSGASTSCSRGGYDGSAMTTIVQGSSGEACQTRTQQRGGMCDYLQDLSAANVSVRYDGSGLGTAGNPADPLPLVTVTVTDLEYDFVFLNRLLPGLRRMGDVSATVMAEDLTGGA